MIDWEPGDGSTIDRLWLADWRIRMAALYAEVRAAAAIDPAVALGHWRAVRESLYSTHPQSPVPVTERAGFQALHFDSDGSMRFSVRVDPAPPPPPRLAGLGGLSLPNSGPDTLSFTRMGSIELPFPAGPRRLSVFWLAGYAGGLFIPFRDATNGIETYAAGRYLVDAAKSADLGTDPVLGTITVDFDYAVQPSCAFDPRWACPLAPPENQLDIPIRAGERLV
ncbi:MAG: DUF1684 domain-containing protein [Chloroflexi bacterium]|nr:DUF1684 domain-containing protein [Chloroflexota bacterium]